VKVKLIIDTRCVRCHREGGDDPRAELIPLDSYANLDRYLQPVAVAAANGWVRVQEPMNLTRLTQSTHAHLLSFAVLFSLTGLAFAFTSYATSVRCVIAPLALVAIVADVGMWWLARLSDGYGVYVAMAVVFTGGLAGLGAAAQIVLSLWNMYGPKGKLVILLLFVVRNSASSRKPSRSRVRMARNGRCSISRSRRNRSSTWSGPCSTRTATSSRER
jgi:hypothetical protein